MSFMAMGSALYGRLGTVQYTYNTNGTVTTTGTLGCYDSIAPQNPPTNPPYVIYQLASSLDDYTFDPGDVGDSMDYIVKVVSDRYWASAQAFGIYEQTHAHLQDAPLSVAGNQLLRCRRVSRIQYQDRDGYWHVGATYRIDIWSS